MVGKERHDLGRTDGEQLSVGYPIRGIRIDKYLYLRNFKADRWHVGDPEYDYLNCDDSPTKSYLTALNPESPEYAYYLKSFGKRAEEELFDVVNDPDCIINLALNPDFDKIKKDLSQKMTKELKIQNDPRILGNGDMFDYYPHCSPETQKKLYGDKYIDMQKQFDEKFK